MNLFGRVMALLTLVAIVPILLVIAIAIWLDDRGAVFYRQVRVGRYGRTFTMYKFRSMRSKSGPPLTCEGDPRVTRVGRFLRAHKLDELPQFWNIVRGEMAWIGPRPEVPEFVDMEGPLWRQVFATSAGFGRCSEPRVSKRGTASGRRTGSAGVLQARNSAAQTPPQH